MPLASIGHALNNGRENPLFENRPEIPEREFYTLPIYTTNK